MSGGDFFDTNVFIYLFDDADARKQATAQSLVSRALAAGDAAISFQVVQETLHVLTRKFTRQVTPEVAAQILQNSLLPLWRVQPSPALYDRALALQERYAFSFYDSLIIAAALEAGSQRLLTEDLHNGQQIDGLTIHNPFTDSFTD
ncbi:MAG: PIN domain-containing protein [Gammaproteobacteria bacterium]|mgnify:CR=1 FL=1|nr:PIN domain-containing protein [Gammaproteobacteria bacterium]